MHRALKFACKAHKGQWLDGESPLPYLSHPIDVMCRLRYIGRITDEAVLAAALLHDVLEETPVSAREIEAEFGLEVRKLVVEMTRAEPEASEIAGLAEPQIWRLRSDRMMGEIAEMSPKAQTLKLADRSSNLNTALATRKGEKLARYLWQSANILAAIRREVCPPLWDEIAGMLERHPLPPGWKPPVR